MLSIAAAMLEGIIPPSVASASVLSPPPVARANMSRPRPLRAESLAPSGSEGERGVICLSATRESPAGGEEEGRRGREEGRKEGESGRRMKRESQSEIRGVGEDRRCRRTREEIRRDKG
jgi:hypothetical protein